MSDNLKIKKIPRSAFGVGKFYEHASCQLFGIGSPESNVSVTTNNAQNTIGNAAPDSVQVALGGINKIKGDQTINVSTDAQTLQAAEDSVASTVASAFQFGAETETLAAQTVGASQATINALAGQITGNASVIDAATGLPVTNSGGADWNKITGYSAVLGVAVALLAFLRRK